MRKRQWGSTVAGRKVYQVPPAARYAYAGRSGVPRTEDAHRGALHINGAASNVGLLAQNRPGGVQGSCEQHAS